ncbi:MULTISPECIES: hypothetical protein [Limosilactobacillus]|uniref:Uncharacterized protein n=1 Tax=Limosilactobacillus reuteri TaxID=1598 RepID=A0A517D6C9_LIMRT|nr:hypothetical protein [Limosilactobacillus reuteri]QDR72915.1 hypothetical protein FOD75_07485 [Limosilactobacillus reuteri]
MRLKESDLTTVYIKKPENTQDDEGYSIAGWGNPQAIRMNVQSAGGAVNAQLYGKDIKYIKTCKYQGNLLSEGHGEGYGVCLKVPSTANPDYKITAIQEFSTHKNITLERIKRDEQSD